MLVQDTQDVWSPEARRAKAKGKHQQSSKLKVPGTPGQVSHEQKRISNIISRVKSKKHLNAEQKKEYISRLVISRANRIGTPEKIERFAKALESVKMPDEARRVRAIGFSSSLKGYNEKASKRALERAQELEKRADREFREGKKDRLAKTLQYLKEKRDRGDWI